jgi:Protein of unknown function (DUF3631)
VAKSGLTPEQRFKRLFLLSRDKTTTPAEREAAKRKCEDWLKRQGKDWIDVPAILAKAERDDDAGRPPPPPPPDPRAGAPHPFDDSRYNPATLVEDIARRYLAMRPHVRVIYILFIIASHIYDQFRVAPRALLTSEGPDSGKTTALEVARSLMFRPNEEVFGTAAALRDHLSLGSCSVALDEADLYDPATRQALLLLWNLGHTRTQRAVMAGGQRKVTSLFAPIIAAGLGRILGQAQLSRTFVLGMSPYTTDDAPSSNWWAPADDGPESAEARKAELDTVYAYLRHCAGVWKIDRQPPMPAGIARRSADNFRSLLAVADACGGEWPQRAREAAVALASAMSTEQPKVLILRHGLMLFDRFEADWLEVGRFNRELRDLGAAELDWNAYCGASGLEQSPHPITVSEEGRLLSSAGVKSHAMWSPDVPRARRKPGDCRRVYVRGDFEEALRKGGRPPPVLRLIQS